MTLEQNTDSIAHAPPPSGQPRGPLAGIRVLDVSTVHAAPITAMLLGDYGADEIEVEHPTGDPARIHGWKREGQGLWWTVISRNKRAITLSFSKPGGRSCCGGWSPTPPCWWRNLRPGVMGKWGLGPDQLLKINPRLVMLRATGFGRPGPTRSGAPSAR